MLLSAAGVGFFSKKSSTSEMRFSSENPETRETRRLRAKPPSPYLLSISFQLFRTKSQASDLPKREEETPTMILIES